MIVSVTFEIPRIISGPSLSKLLRDLHQRKWRLSTDGKPSIQGYVDRLAMNTHEYDFQIDSPNSLPTNELFPQELQIMSVAITIESATKQIDAYLVVDNAALVLGVDLAAEDVLGGEDQEAERASAKLLVDAGRVLLEQIGPARGAITVEADIRSEVVGLDWRFWPLADVEQVSTQSLRAVRHEARFFYDLGSHGIFVALTPLLQPPVGGDYERRMRILDHAFGTLGALARQPVI